MLGEGGIGREQAGRSPCVLLLFSVALALLFSVHPRQPPTTCMQVADFGLSLHIDAGATHVSDAFQGTLTHMAPGGSSGCAAA